MNNIKISKNFNLTEYQCKCGCNQVIINSKHALNNQAFRDFLNKDKAEGEKETVLVSNSSYRCETNNVKSGGAKTSQHRLGNADDWIAYNSGMTVMELYEKALEFGKYKGVIAYPNRGIVHCDSRQGAVHRKIDYSRGVKGT